MVENCLNKSLGFGTRVQNLLSDLETRLPKLPMANDSRHRLPPQPSCREGRESRGAGPERTLGIANESRVIVAERRANKQAAVDRRGVYPAFPQQPDEDTKCRVARERWSELQSGMRQSGNGFSARIPL